MAKHVFEFVKQLQHDITLGKFVPVAHKAGDWLQSLPDLQLELLTQIVEQQTDDTQVIDSIVALVINLSALETGIAITPSIEQLEELLDVFILLIRLECLRRQSYIELPRTLSLNDDIGELRFTQKGMAMADHIRTVLGQ